MMNHSHVLKLLIAVSLACYLPNLGQAQSTSFEYPASFSPVNEEGTISDFIEKIHQKFNVSVVYEAKKLPQQKVSFDLSAFTSAETALKALLKPYGLSLQRLADRNYAVVASSQGKDNLEAATSPTQSTLQSGVEEKVITGKVVDGKSGLPLAGVSIVVKGTAQGTQTNDEGKFTIKLNSTDSLLVVTLVGFETQQINAFTGNTNISLREAASQLNEVVVIGYGTKSRKTLSSAVSSIGTKEITATPAADAAQALQGRVAGVTIVQNSGAPGGTGGTSIRIRGISSLTGTNNPLIVVDGYPLPDQGADNILNSFGTGDIESIDVLKDAAAAAIYGVRASNGVIMITTKRGKAGKASLNVDIYRGLQSAWKLPDMLDAREYAVLNSEARIASGLAVIPKLADFEAIGATYGKGTNWLDEVFRRAAITSVNISASGGSENAKYLLSGGYLKQDGILYKTDYERFNLRFNGDVKVNKHLKLGNSMLMSKSIEHGADTYSAFNSILLLSLTSPPTVLPRNADGTYAGGNGADDGFNEPNPIYQLEVPQNEYTKYRINGNIFAEWEFLKTFRFKALFGADYTLSENRNFSPATAASGGRPIINTGYFTQKSLNPDYLAEYTLTYDKTFGSDHKVNAVLGYTFQENRYSYVFAGRGNGLFNPQIPVLNDRVLLPTDLSQTYNGAEDGVNSRLISYIGRVNYDFANKIFLSATVRRDGSSNFAPANRFAIFPSFSAAWRLSQEAFMQKLDWISELKVRASFGYTGNPNVQAYSYLQKINQSFQYTFGNSAGSGGVVAGAAPSASFNPDIRWEKNEQLNLGVDASILRNKVNLSLDVYQRRSIDLILYVAPPFISGTYESVPYNTGTLQNRGLDLTVSSTVISTKSTRWNITGVLGTYTNKVISLGLSAPLDNGFSRITGGSLRTTQGLPANYFYGFKTDGIFQSYDEIKKSATQTAGTDPTTSTAPGDIKFKDLNADGVIDEKDRTNIGNSNPTFTYGLTNSVTYKNLELTVFVQGSVGNKVLNFTRWYTEGGVSNGNYSKDVINRWNGIGSSNSMPRLVLNDPNNNSRVSDRFVEDASYLRIKNVRLAYNLPGAWTKYVGLRRAQLYGSIQNLVTITKYKGMDPEVGGGVDLGFYPQARTILIGATIDL